MDILRARALLLACKDDMITSLHREVTTLTKSIASFTGSSTEFSLVLQAERARKSAAAAAASYHHAQRSLWLRSPDCLQQVLTMVAFSGHPAWSFSSLTRAFRGDETLWGYLKGKCGGSKGRTPLMACCHTGDAARVRWLLSLGADVHAVDAEGGRTCLVHASSLGHVATVRTLLKEGISLYEKSTCLLYACIGGHTEVARVLLEHSAVVDTFFMSGRTPLMHVCRAGDIATARLLLKHGASKTLADQEGLTAYMHTDEDYGQLLDLVRV